MKTWMIYGATGYTGKLIAERAITKGQKPILAGRSESTLRPLAESLGLEYRIFDLNDEAKVKKGLEGIWLVLNCAGPFSATYRPMIQGCLAAKAHYLDITGEVVVFENLAAMSDQAKERGIVMIPGVGFDVVPSDSLAGYLAHEMPEAKELELAFATAGTISPGTMKTMAEHLGTGGLVRRGGKLVASPLGEFQKSIHFTSGKHYVASIPWGDVSTAYHSTGIPNITVYAISSRSQAKMMKALKYAAPVLKAKPVVKLIQKVIGKVVKGPSDQARETGSTHLWGKVTDGKGKSLEAHLDGPEGYEWTVRTALAAVMELQKEVKVTGFATPSKAFGWEFIERVGGAKLSPQPPLAH